MIYKCQREYCGFLFSRAGEPDVCPDCGSHAIRPATLSEQREYEDNLNKIQNDNTEED